MLAIEELLAELDRQWQTHGAAAIRLDVIGSAALMLQSDYERGTKDGDILQIRSIDDETRTALLRLAGRNSPLHRRFRIYLDIVAPGLLFLPQVARFHRTTRPKGLSNFKVRVLDVSDVAVSKLARFSANDQADIRAMVERDILSRKRLIERFQVAVDAYSMDARAEDLPRYVRNLHRVERDFFGLDETPISLPDWIIE